MKQLETAKVFMSGRSQAVRIPLAYRFATDEVYIRRDERTGDVVLSSKPEPKPKPSWDEIFKALDEADFPDDFLADRNQRESQVRPDLLK